jgi:hypothetical protein
MIGRAHQHVEAGAPAGQYSVCEAVGASSGHDLRSGIAAACSARNGTAQRREYTSALTTYSQTHTTGPDLLGLLVRNPATTLELVGEELKNEAAGQGSPIRSFRSAPSTATVSGGASFPVLGDLTTDRSVGVLGKEDGEEEQVDVRAGERGEGSVAMGPRSRVRGGWGSVLRYGWLELGAGRFGDRWWKRRQGGDSWLRWIVFLK